jgi:hypothetical protein
MARILSIEDEDSGVTASVRVINEDGTRRITRVVFEAAPGRSITADDLSMIASVGLLELPDASIPSVPPHQDVIPAAPKTARELSPSKATKSARAAAPKAPTKPDQRRAKRYTGGVPSDEDLLALFNRHGGSPTKMAEEIGASPSSINNWMNQARERQVKFVKPA